MDSKKEKSEVFNPNVWVGTRTGLLKSLYFQNKTAKNHFEEAKYGKDFEIISMCWDCKESTKINLGLKDKVVKTYNTLTNKFDESHLVPGLELEKDGELCGVKNLDGTFIAGMSMGKVVYWRPESDNFETIRCGDRLVALSSLPGSNTIATGGKETPMKVWDLNNNEKPIFTAKNVRPDWKQLRVAIWVTSIQFVDNSPTKILTTTGHHHIRIYDLNTRQRRPVLETTFDEYPITTSSMPSRTPNKVYVANTRGRMASFDIRNLKNIYRCFKGPHGSVRQIENHPTLPYLFSCGLDCCLRVHNERDSTPVIKIPFYGQLNCLLVTDAELEKKCNSDLEENDKSDSKDEDESVWNNMDKVVDSDEDKENPTKKPRLD